MIWLSGPERAVYTFVDEQPRELSLAALREGARRLGRALRSETGRPVLVAAGWGPEQPVALLGAWCAGAVAVPVYPEAPDDVLAAIARSCGARVVVGSEPGALAARLGLGAVPVAADAPDGEPAPLAEAALLLYTSGSTGSPKGATLTHAGLRANMQTLAARTGRSGDDVVVSWLPHAHVAGLYLRLLPLVLGARGVLLAPASFAARPAGWLEALSRFRGTFSAAPDFAYALCADAIPDEVVDRLDLSRWQMAVSGGEAVRAATLERFQRRFARAGFEARAFHPYYGLTETLCTSIPQGNLPARLRASRAGLASSRLRPPADEADTIELIGNGPPLGDETAVRIVDPDALVACPPGRIGEIWTAGPGVTPGYFGDPERTREACAARAADGQGPFFRTGDLGLLHQGQVFVTGRRKELLIVRGKNHYPADIEATALRAGGALGARDAAAFRVWDDGEEALGLAVEVQDADEAALLRALRRAIAERHGLALGRLFFLPPGRIPRTPTRKIERHRCTALAEGGGWSAWALASRRTARAAPAPSDASLSELRGPALRAALLTRLLARLAEGEVGALDARSVDRPIAELGVSSLELARLAAALRRDTGVEPPFSAFYDGTSLRGAAEQIAAAMEGDAAAPPGAPGWRDTIRRVALALPDLLPPPRARPGALLLTGATGFLGSWLLARLLAQGATDVRCLVRAPDEAQALARLRRALPAWDERWSGRFQAIVGDVTAPRLGLAAPAWERLADEVATVVHNAANVHFVSPYAALRATNVDPVHDLASLALAGGEARTLHLVSTIAVFNAPERREARRILETDRRDDPGDLYSGYAQSKFVAEAAFRGIGARGVPVGIHRPGLITGDSLSGRAHVDDFLCRFLKGCVELGRCPDADVDLDLTPVDAVADGIAAAALRPVQGTTTYHWTCPTRFPMARLFGVLRARGHRVDPEPLAAWLHRLRTALPPDNALFPVHPFLLEIPRGGDETILELLDGIPHDIDDAHAAAVRASAGLPRVPVDDALLNRMAGWLEATGFLPAPKSPL